MVNASDAMWVMQQILGLKCPGDAIDVARGNVERLRAEGVVLRSKNLALQSKSLAVEEELQRWNLLLATVAPKRGEKEER